MGVRFPCSPHLSRREPGSRGCSGGDAPPEVGVTERGDDCFDLRKELSRRLENSTVSLCGIHDRAVDVEDRHRALGQRLERLKEPLGFRYVKLDTVFVNMILLL
jgi:hypothetical protein